MLRPLLLLAIIPATALAAAAPAKNGSLRFEVKTPKRTQALTVVRTSDKAISFELAISGDCQRTAAGGARLRSGPLRKETDETGKSYEAEEFVYLSEGCGLFLRIEHKQAKRATVAQAGACHNLCVPLPETMIRASPAPAKKHAR